MGKYSDTILGETQPTKAPLQPKKYAEALLGGGSQSVTPASPSEPQRLDLWPYPQGALTGQEGPVDWTDWVAPEVVGDIVESVKLPGKALRGEPISEQDITRAAMNIGIPALRGIGSTGTRQLTKQLTRRQVKEAPTTAGLKKAGGELFESAKGSAAVVDPDSYSGFLYRMKNDLFKSGYDENLHPTAKAAIQAVSKRANTELDFQDLMIVRRQIANAANSINPDEARIGSRMISQLDEYVDNLNIDDLVGGAVSGPGVKVHPADELRQARKLWTQQSKSSDIDAIFDAAKNQASGFENGLRIGFRQLLNNKRRIKGYSKDEVAAMREVVEGNFTRNTLKRLGKIGGGSGQQTNVLGMMGGSAGGAAIGSLVAGPPGAAVGAVAAPAIGYGAQKLGERGTRLAAEKARALAAGARGMSQMAFPGSQRYPRTALGVGMGRGMQADTKTPEQQKMEELARFLAAGGA